MPEKAAIARATSPGLNGAGDAAGVGAVAVLTGAEDETGAP
jgi:hypothetical protein